MTTQNIDIRNIPFQDIGSGTASLPNGRFLKKDDKSNLNIVDTIDSLFINYNLHNNEKIKEIYNIIDIDCLIYEKDLSVDDKCIKKIQDIFENNKENVSQESLYEDIKNYLEIDSKIEELQKTQSLIKKNYNNKDNKNLSSVIINDFDCYSESLKMIERPVSQNLGMGFKWNNCVNKEESKKFIVDGFPKNDDYMKFGDYSLCSSNSILNDTNYKLFKDLKIKKCNCYLIYINYYNTSIILKNEDYDITNLIKNYSDFILIEHCEQEKLEKLTEFLHKRTFNSIEDFKNVYNSLKSNLPRETTDSVMEFKVKNYIYSKYKITTDVCDRQKASEFYNKVKKDIQFTFDSRQFSQILLNLGLQKKRYQDGIYYYGLKMINIEKLSPVNRHSKELLFNGLPDEYPKLSLKETNNLIKEKITEREIKITPDLI
jgi:hypothetical protein